MPTVDAPVLVARFRDEYVGLVSDTGGGIHKFLRENSVFRVRDCRDRWGGFYEIEGTAHTLEYKYVDLITNLLYIVTIDGVRSYHTMEDLLPMLSGLSEGIDWSFRPYDNPNEVTVCPTLQSY